MRPFILGIGGTTRPGSSSERALRAALARAEAHGARTEILTGRMLDLPNYDPTDTHRPPAVRRLVDLLRAADGVLVSTPAYHGGPSGMIKNALDYVEDMAGDARPYLDGRAVGIIVTAYGEQAMGTTLTAMRSVVHALRGWPAAVSVTLNGRDRPFAEGVETEERLIRQIDMLAEQVTAFAAWQAGRTT